MYKSTEQIVLIPQLRMKRTVYADDDGTKYIMVDKEWWSMDGYKAWLKDRYSINISYEFR